MSWPLVALSLGLVTLAVAVYALRLWRSMHLSALYDKDSLNRISALEMTLADRTTRITRLEAALRIDGARIMHEAARNAVPAFMK